MMRQVSLVLSAGLIFVLLLMGVLAVDWGRESVRASEYPAISSTVQRVAYFPVAPNSSYYYTYTVVHVYPHDPDAFTQGLVFEDDRLFEGTGLYGQSSLREVDLESGAVLRSLSLPPQYFGEGITIHDNRIVQLTWRSNIGFVYDRDSFELLEDFEYPTEGWGITHDGRQLIVSDGTATLYFWDPATLSEVGRIEVRDQYGPVNRLNELEYVRGEVFANVWYTDLIARIDPHTGQVLGWINLEGLLDSGGGERAADVLNGIAYDAENDRLFVTGKLWPWLFEIELVPAK